jgi:hypothetical protein
MGYYWEKSLNGTIMPYGLLIQKWRILFWVKILIFKWELSEIMILISVKNIIVVSNQLLFINIFDCYYIYIISRLFIIIIIEFYKSSILIRTIYI